MLPKELRLLSHEISTIKRHGEKLSGEGIQLYYLPSHDLHARFSFIVTKKAAKKAVVRNTIKRELRRIVSNYYKNLQHPFSVVIVMNSPKESHPESLHLRLITLLEKM